MTKTEQIIPGMLSIQEQNYLIDYTSTQYQGHGQIVDLGCWMGSSAASMAKGLEKNAHAAVKAQKIHAFDIFTWEGWMDQCVAGTPYEGKFRPGDCFYEACLNHTKPWKDRITFYPGDLNQFIWNEGPIEFLFIDAMKSWELAVNIPRQFFPSLIPRVSTIVHQDFSHFGTYWIHLLMFRLREYFEPDKDIPSSWSYVFRYQKEIPSIFYTTDLSLSSFSLEEIYEAFQWAANLVPLEKRCQILGAKVICLLQKGFLHEAKCELENALAEGLANHEHNLPLGLNFPLVILDHFVAREAHDPVKAVDEIPQEPKVHETKVDFEYSGERHMMEQRDHALSFGHTVHMVRYAFASRFCQGKKVLDVACGSGYGTEFLALQGASEVVGVDKNIQAVEYAQRHHAHAAAQYIAGDAERLVSFEDHSFDMIISFETLEHLQNPQKCISEFKRLLKPGGQIFLSCPNDLAVPFFASPYHLHSFTFDCFCELIQQSFPDAIFLGQYHQLASGIFDLPQSSNTAPFTQYQTPLSVHSVGNVYLEQLPSKKDAEVFLAIVGVDRSEIQTHLSLSENAFMVFIKSLQWATEQIQLKTKSCLTMENIVNAQRMEAQAKERQLNSLLSSMKDEMNQLRESMKKIRKEKSETEFYLADLQKSRFWKLRQRAVALRAVFLKFIGKHSD